MIDTADGLTDAPEAFDEDEGAAVLGVVRGIVFVFLPPPAGVEKGEEHGVA